MPWKSISSPSRKVVPSSRASSSVWLGTPCQSPWPTKQRNHLDNGAVPEIHANKVKCWSWVNWKQQDEPEKTLDLVFHCRLSNLGWATWHLWSQFSTCKLGKIMSCFTSITSWSWRSPWDMTRQPQKQAAPRSRLLTVGQTLVPAF